MNGWLDCFQYLSIINNAEMNIFSTYFLTHMCCLKWKLGDGRGCAATSICEQRLATNGEGAHQNYIGEQKKRAGTFTLVLRQRLIMITLHTLCVMKSPQVFM